MNFFKLLKKFFLIFGSKLDRTLDELDSIKNRSHRILKQYNEARCSVVKTFETTEGKAALYEDKVVQAKQQIDSLNKALLLADSEGNTSDVEIIASELDAAEKELDVLQSTLDLFVEHSKELEEELKTIDEDIVQAQQTLSLAEVRYDAAKALVDLHSDSIPNGLRAQIEQVRRDADEMSSRYKGIKRVKEKTKPVGQEVVKKYNTSQKSAQERLAALKGNSAVSSVEGN